MKYALITASAVAALAIGIGSTTIGSTTADAAQAGADAFATVSTAISIQKTADLDFGNFAVGPTGGTVTIDAASDPNRGSSGDVVLQTGGGEQSASFDVDGEDTQSYTVTLSAGPTVLTHTNTVDFMNAALLADPAVGGPPGNGVIASGDTTLGNENDLFVGGTLTVLGDQEPGSYAGSFTVDVDYP